jgi:hypothetical protein
MATALEGLFGMTLAMGKYAVIFLIKIIRRGVRYFFVASFRFVAIYVNVEPLNVCL